MEEVNPYVSGGFPGRTSLSVSDRIYGCCRALCLIISRNVHLKQYFHMSVQFNIWVTPSSQLQNTPQHGSSGQPIMQHVTKVVGSTGAQSNYKGKMILFSETQSDDRNEVTMQNVTVNQHYGLISGRSPRSRKALQLFERKEHSKTRMMQTACFALSSFGLMLCRAVCGLELCTFKTWIKPF